MTTNFYAPPSAFRKSRVVLPEEEARHARTVLRVEEGDTISVVDGGGGWYRVRVDHLAPKQVVGTVVDQQAEARESETAVTVAMGMLTKRRRFETFVEKAVELGATRIVPLRTARTEAEDIRRERLRNVMIAALKQCRRSRLPALAAPQSLEEVVDAKKDQKILLCHPHERAVPILDALDDPTPSIQVLVGSEGGFAPTEVETVLEAGGQPVSLGARRLRAETAALAAVNAVGLVQQRRQRME